MTDVEQPASVPSFGGFGKFMSSLPLLYFGTSVSGTLSICVHVFMLTQHVYCWSEVCSRRCYLHHCAVADAFADAETDDNNSKDYVHIRIQQRNGKKSLTTVQVIPA